MPIFHFCTAHYTYAQQNDTTVNTASSDSKKSVLFTYHRARGSVALY